MWYQSSSLKFITFLKATSLPVAINSPVLFTFPISILFLFFEVVLYTNNCKLIKNKISWFEFPFQKFRLQGIYYTQPSTFPWKSCHLKRIYLKMPHHVAYPSTRFSHNCNLLRWGIMLWYNNTQILQLLNVSQLRPQFVYFHWLIPKMLSKLLQYPYVLRYM